MHALAASYARQGIGLTTIGIGEQFDVEVMRGLAEVGAGNFYFLEDPAAAREVFTEEVATFLHPVALDVEIGVATGPAYTARRVYGTRHYEGGSAGGVIRIPSLFIAGRRSAQEPIENGRRGGGGAILVELLPRAASALANLQLTSGERAQVGAVSIRWTDPLTGARHESSTTITSPHDPNATPVEGWFVDQTVEKGFVMLNLFAGFQLAAQLALDADPGAARGVLESLEEGVADWLRDHSDPDIADDLSYVQTFVDNLASLPSPTPVARPPEPWPND
jgi:Ca-activated chloride channel family protein